MSGGQETDDECPVPSLGDVPLVVASESSAHPVQNVQYPIPDTWYPIFETYPQIPETLS